VAVIGLCEGLLERLRNRDLSRHIGAESTSFMHCKRGLNQVLGPDSPADLPASAVEHLARAEHGDSLAPVSFTVVSENFELTAIEGQMEVDLI